jgi:DNA mismatch endonuclease (patch repair protein)
MSRIRSKDTKIEILIAKELWNKGLRYRKNDKSIQGKPDLTFKKIKLAIFCDSEFWHGKDWDVQQKRIGTNKAFWIQKIQNNINRDRITNEKLTNTGWIVLRFWETDIKKNLDECILKIIETIKYLKLGVHRNSRIL